MLKGVSSCMNKCTNIKTLNTWQVEQLKEHLSKHKYYLGEQGIHLDQKSLEGDFLSKYITEVAQELRLHYCSCICTERHGCNLAEELFKKILDD